ncbi:MAG: hypothetical protein AAF713_03520 [Pseudomonadota bacterium]
MTSENPQSAAKGASDCPKAAIPADLALSDAAAVLGDLRTALSTAKADGQPVLIELGEGEPSLLSLQLLASARRSAAESGTDLTFNDHAAAAAASFDEPRGFGDVSV